MLGKKASDHLIIGYLSHPPDVKHLPPVESLTTLPLLQFHYLVTASPLATAPHSQHKQLLLSSYSWDIYDYLFALPPFDQEKQRILCKELLSCLCQFVPVREFEIMLLEKLSNPTFQASHICLILFSTIFAFQGYQKEKSGEIIDFSTKGCIASVLFY
jgi:hypothetical protein